MHVTARARWTHIDYSGMIRIKMAKQFSPEVHDRFRGYGHWSDTLSFSHSYSCALSSKVPPVISFELLLDRNAR